MLYALRASTDLVPILVKIQQLQRLLLIPDNRQIFESSWNWVDAFLRIVHGADSEMYLMLRQAMMARRVLLLLDGIDEGGKLRNEIEAHVNQVLARQGHLMLVTSRPAGINEKVYQEFFFRIELNPLTKRQQRQVMNQRLGDVKVGALVEKWVDQAAPRDAETGEHVTGNPLMLRCVRLAE